MKKGRKFYENENLIIYVGTAIFFILAISVGIVMYMTTKANSKVGNETGKSITENIENVEDASSNMGKTVEEQERIADQKNDEISNRTESTTTEIIENTKKPTHQEILWINQIYILPDNLQKWHMCLSAQSGITIIRTF